MRPVIWSKTAQRDTLEILRYIADDDLFAAERVVDAIEHAGYRIGEMATGRPGRVRACYAKVRTGFALLEHAESISQSPARECE